jgi:hypothetical protein
MAGRIDDRILDGDRTVSVESRAATPMTLISSLSPTGTNTYLISAPR